MSFKPIPPDDSWSVRQALITFLFFAIGLLALSMCRSAQGQHCQVVNRTAVDVFGGSGTLIHKMGDGAAGLVLSCNHIFDEAGVGQVLVSFPGGKTHMGRVVGQDPEHDISAIAIRNPAEQPLDVVFDLTGETFCVCGFGGDLGFRKASGNIVGYVFGPKGDKWVEINVEARQGDSGGALVDEQGRLAGVVGLKGPGATDAMFGQPLADLLRPRIEAQCRGRRCYPKWLSQPNTTTVRPSGRPTVVPPQPTGCDCADKWAAIEAWQVKLEARIAAIEKQPGPTGPAGPIGPPGPSGQDGQSAEVAEVAAEVAANLPGITVRYLNQDGTPFDTETVKLGETLDIEPIHVERFVNGELVGESFVPVGGDLKFWERER